MIEKVFWSFDKAFTSYEEFVNEVTEHNNSISKNHKWNSEEVVTKSATIKVYFIAKWKDENDRLEILIKNDNGDSLKMAEVLFQINNAAVDFLEEVDGGYFEGLNEEGFDGEIPLYRMSIGS